MSSDPATRRPRPSTEADSRDVFEFVNLAGQREVFDISDPAHENFPWHRIHISNCRRDGDDPDPARCIWYGRADDRLDETLIRMLGCRWVSSMIS